MNASTTAIFALLTLAACDASAPQAACTDDGQFAVLVSGRDEADGTWLLTAYDTSPAGLAVVGLRLCYTTPQVQDACLPTTPLGGSTARFRFAPPAALSGLEFQPRIRASRCADEIALSNDIALPEDPRTAFVVDVDGLTSSPATTPSFRAATPVTVRVRATGGPASTTVALSATRIGDAGPAPSLVVPPLADCPQGSACVTLTRTARGDDEAVWPAMFPDGLYVLTVAEVGVPDPRQTSVPIAAAGPPSFTQVASGALSAGATRQGLVTGGTGTRLARCSLASDAFGVTATVGGTPLTAGASVDLAASSLPWTLTAPSSHRGTEAVLTCDDGLQQTSQVRVALAAPPSRPALALEAAPVVAPQGGPIALRLDAPSSAPVTLTSAVGTFAGQAPPVVLLPSLDGDAFTATTTFLAPPGTHLLSTASADGSTTTVVSVARPPAFDPPQLALTAGEDTPAEVTAGAGAVLTRCAQATQGDAGLTLSVDGQPLDDAIDLGTQAAVITASTTPEFIGEATALVLCADGLGQSQVLTVRATAEAPVEAPAAFAGDTHAP